MCSESVLTVHARDSPDQTEYDDDISHRSSLRAPPGSGCRQISQSLAQIPTIVICAARRWYGRGALEWGRLRRTNGIAAIIDDSLVLITAYFLRWIIRRPVMIVSLSPRGKTVPNPGGSAWSMSLSSCIAIFGMTRIDFQNILHMRQ